MLVVKQGTTCASRIFEGKNPGALMIGEIRERERERERERAHIGEYWRAEKTATMILIKILGQHSREDTTMKAEP